MTCSSCVNQKNSRTGSSDTPRIIARASLAAFRLALAREPDRSELDSLAAYAKKHGLANACRLLFNTNEFAFVD